MRELYSTTTRVVIWWGDVVDLNTQAKIAQSFGAAQDLHAVVLQSADGFHTSFASDIQKIELLEQTVEKPEDILRPMEFSILDAGLPWMTRLWTLQEAVLSREDPAVMLGTDMSSLWTLMQLQECLASATWEGMFQGHASENELLAVCDTVLYDMHLLASNLSGRWKLTKTKPNSRSRLLAEISVRLFSRGIRGIRSRTGSSAPVPAPDLAGFGAELLELLTIFGGRKATTPHDQLYGLLGLTTFPNLPANLRPDYRRSVEEVCFDYTIFLIKTTNSLQVLGMSIGKFKGFPTWVSDFTRDLLYPPNVTSYVPVFSENDRCIEVPGANLGKIVTVYSPVLRGVSVFDKSDFEVLEIFLSLAREIMIPASQILNCDPHLVFNDWAEGSSVCRIFGAKVADVRHVSEFSLDAEAPLIWGQEASSCVSALRTYLNITTQVLLSTGTIFHCSTRPQELRPWNIPLAGDYVYALKGLTVPALLRPCRQESGFEVTGTCYSITVKDQNLNEEFFRRRELETIRLY
ncbi:hypothetical protein ACEPPN_012383 [Leptodophora sp. 'Broadleaf-Isolate-01']